jgi:hypothetical protein
MLKISKDSSDGILSSASYHGFNLMGYNPLYGKYLFNSTSHNLVDILLPYQLKIQIVLEKNIFTKINPNSRSAKKYKNNNNKVFYSISLLFSSNIN